MKTLPGPTSLFIFVCFVGIFTVNVAAQHQTGNNLPKVGMIKDYGKAVGSIPDGCGNHFVTFSGRLHDKGNVYISRPDGDGAAMNLDGRDTPLKLKKTTLVYDKNGSRYATHEYRAGKLRITTRFWELTDYISEYSATIILRNGKSTRKLNLKLGAQCD